MEEVIIYKSTSKELFYLIVTFLLGLLLAYPFEGFDIMMFGLGCLITAYAIYATIKFLRKRMKGRIPALTITDQRVIVNHEGQLDVFFSDVKELVLRKYKGRDVIEIKYKDEIREKLEAEHVIKKKRKKKEYDEYGDENEQLEDFISVEDLSMKKEAIFALLQARLEEASQ